MRKPLSWPRLAAVTIGVLAVGLPAASAGNQAVKAPPPDIRYNVLVFTTSNDAATSAGIAAIRSAGQTPHAQYKFYVNAPDPNGARQQFRDVRLDKFRAVVFLDTGAASGLSQDQKDAFERYFRRGGGVVLVGSSIETDPSWQFLTDILGARTSTTAAAASAAGDSNLKVAGVS